MAKKAKKAAPEPNTGEYLHAMPATELHARAVDLMDQFHNVAGNLPRNRCYDGFARLAAVWMEMRPGALEYGKRIAKRQGES